MSMILSLVVVIKLICLVVTVSSFKITSSRQKCRSICMMAENQAKDPLLLRAARGEEVERVPVWMMRQAGRHMKAYRDLCAKHKTFRERSEIAEVATEIRYISPINAALK
jgi:uroporphyrinogen decarboxylase